MINEMFCNFRFNLIPKRESQYRAKAFRVKSKCSVFSFQICQVFLAGGNANIPLVNPP